MNASTRCNNLGVEFYRQGRLLEARAAFRCAAKLLHPASCGQEVIGNNPIKPRTNNEDEEALISQTFLDLLALDEGGFNCSALHEENSFFSTDTHMIDDEASLPASIASAGIIMNIALTYLHEKNEAPLLFALNLFEIAYILIVQQQVDYSCHSSTEKIVLTCLNNAAQIQFSLGNHCLSRQYLSTLVHYIRRLPIAHEVARKEFRSRFLLNAVIMQDTSAARAA